MFLAHRLYRHCKLQRRYTLRTYRTSDTSKYDDLPPPVPGVPEAEQVGIYHGLNYSIFDYGPQGILPKVVPVSAPNLATFTLVNTLAMGAVTTNPFSVITTSGSTASFDFLYFYFACGQVTGTNLAGVATGCGITITGFCKNGQRAPDASFNYAPTSTNNAPLTLATLPLYYVDLKNVTIAISTSTVLTSATLFLMDNLAHRNYYC